MSSPKDQLSSDVNRDLSEERFRERELESDLDVTKLHGAILREMDEPMDGHEPISLWMMGLIVAYTMFCFGYLGLYSGGFAGDQFFFTPITKRGPVGPVGPPDPMVLGKKLYTANCVSCHQSTGLGQAGQFPPLAGSEWVIGDAPNRLISIVLHGLNGPVTVKGDSYNGAMAPWEGVFNDAQLAAILTYIRGSWGNTASPISAEAVAAMREKTKAQKGTPYNSGQLLAMPPDAEILKLGPAAGAAAPAPGAAPAAPAKKP